jgi:hypothetical protein
LRCVYGVYICMVCGYACVFMMCAVYVYENLTNYEIFIYAVPHALTSTSGPRLHWRLASMLGLARRRPIHTGSPAFAPWSASRIDVSTGMYISRKFLDIYILKI